MAFSIFGYKFTKADTTKQPKGVEKITTPLPDGSAEFDVISSIDANSYAFDWEIEISKEAELIDTYRKTAALSETDSAINDIVNEAIVVEYENPAIELTFTDNCKFSDAIQKKVLEEFEEIMMIMDFDVNGPQMFRQWFIDGKHYYHKVVDTNNLTDGIQELNWLDPCRIKKVRENITEIGKGNIEVIVGHQDFFVYDPTPKAGRKSAGQVPTKKQVIKLEADAVSYANSGLIDLETGRALSHLHKAIKPANQLSLLEDSMVIARLVRAPERRVFYIDTGNLPKTKAEQYMTSIISKYKNKLAYDVESGTVKANKHHLSMLEDIWLPRKEGGKGTEVDTIDGQRDLGDIEDITYFRRKLYNALNLPVSRMDSEQVFTLGASGEISRDEIKFTKFIHKLRGRFNALFLDLLKTQLLLKKKITEQDWDNEKTNLEFIYNVDSHFAEMKKTEIMENRLNGLQSVDDYVGRYFSINWVRKEILHMTDEEIEEIDEEIEEEQAKAEAGETPDPGFGGMMAIAGQEAGFEEEEEGAPPGGGEEPAPKAEPKKEPEKKEPEDKPKEKKDGEE